MGWKQWSAVAVLVGGGILLQIPHDEMEMPGPGTEDDGAPSTMVEMPAPYTTVALDVTGMT